MELARLETESLALGETARQLAERSFRIAEDLAENRAIPPPFDILEPAIARIIFDRWPRPCEAAFQFLATRFPRQLAQLVQHEALAATDLTFAAEALGKSSDPEVVIRALLPLLGHRSAVVREGAIHGLQHHMNAEVRSALEAVAREDSNAGVQAAVGDALSDP